MNCNVKECYWNLWRPESELFNDDNSMQCVSENLSEHYDENESFKMTPNSKKCQGYMSYYMFMGEKSSVNPSEK